MRACDAAFLFEGCEVAACGGFGDAEFFADFLEGEVALGGEEFLEFFASGLDDVERDFHERDRLYRLKPGGLWKMIIRDIHFANALSNLSCV